MRIIILFNHFQISDGVTMAAVGMANALVKKQNVEITLRPLFRFDRNMISMLDHRIAVKPVFRTYFKGFSKIVGLFPMKLLHKFIIGDKYDIEVGFCCAAPIRIVAAGENYAVMRFAWMHGYDIGLTLHREYQKIGKVICVSKHNADRLKKESRNRFKVDYAYNLLNDQEIVNKGKERIDIDRSDFIQFVSVGRMSPEKGYLRLIEICARLRDEGYRFSLWLIGDGPQKQELKEKVCELEIGNCVQLLGEQSNPHAYTVKSDVFICSSFNEGYSTACTEAIILGVPVLTTNVSGGEEIINEAECGLLVQKDDDALYQGMRKILENTKLIEEWKNTLKDTSKRFSYTSRAKRLYRLFELEGEFDENYNLF